MATSLPADALVDDLNTASVASWNDNAVFWDDYMGDEGNDFYQVLEMPALERLVSLREGEHVLDLATGNGLVARRMAALGGFVIATDASEPMLECARRRTTTRETARISYSLLDVTNPAEFQELITKSHELVRRFVGG